MDVDSESEYKPSSPPTPPKPRAKKGKGKPTLPPSSDDEAVTPPKPPAKKDKGKQKARPSSDDEEPLADLLSMQLEKKAPVTGDEENSGAKTVARKPFGWENRRKPTATGEYHDPPCDNCARRGLPCAKEEGGGACVLCWKGKIKCNYSTVKNTRPRQRQRRVYAKRTKVQVGVERRVKKSSRYVDVATEDEMSAASASKEVPAPKRPAPRKERSAPRPPASEHGWCFIDRITTTLTDIQGTITFRAGSTTSA
jgi:hypothetical protein